MTIWRRSRSCEAGTCVEIAFDGDVAIVRDAKEIDGPELRFTREEWNAFLAGVAAGDFRFPGGKT